MNLTTLLGLIILGLLLMYYGKTPNQRIINVSKDITKTQASQAIINKPKFIIKMNSNEIGSKEISALADMVIRYEDLLSGNYQIPEKYNPNYDFIKEVIVPKEVDTTTESEEYIDLSSVKI